MLNGEIHFFSHKADLHILLKALETNNGHIGSFSRGTHAIPVVRFNSYLLFKKYKRSLTRKPHLATLAFYPQHGRDIGLIA